MPKVWKAKYSWKKLEGSGGVTVDQASFEAAVQEEERHKHVTVKTDKEGGITVVDKDGLVLTKLTPPAAAAASAESIPSQSINSNKMGKEFQAHDRAGSPMFRLAQSVTVTQTLESQTLLNSC